MVIDRFNMKLTNEYGSLDYDHRIGNKYIQEIV